MNSARTLDSARRREILGRLSAAGFSEARRFPRGVRVDEPRHPAVVRLRTVLQDLGGVFAAWGRYLASRLDLLPETEGRSLGTLPDQRTPAPFQEVRGCLEAELGRPLEECFQAFEPEPVASTLRSQDHLARSLPDGRPFLVRVVQPGLAKNLAEDLECLPLLDAALRECGVQGLEEARADFASLLRRAADLTLEAEALEVLARDAAISPLIKVPRVERALSTTKVMTFEQLPGLTLREMAHTARGRTAMPGSPALGGPQAEQLAGRLCRAWLRQALCGGAFPLELRAADIRILPNHQIAWTGGPWHSLPAAAQTNLWEYVTATAAQDPDRACTALLHEMDAPAATDEEGLRRRFRQLIPFRDGGREARDDLAGYLLLHWRIAVEEGYQPRSSLLAFYRGLGLLMRRSRELAWSGDALREGLEALQLMNGLNEWVHLADPAAMQTMVGDSLTAFLTLPQKLDEVLARATSGGANIKFQVVEPPAARQRKNASTMVIAALLAIVSIVLLAPQFTRLGLSEIWTERATTAAVTLLGVWVLMGVSRWT